MWSYSAALTLIAALIHWTGDAWWIGTVLLFGPRWIWGVPLIGLLPWALLRQRVLLVPLLAAAALQLWPIMGYRWHGAAHPVQRNDVRVLSYNIGGAGPAGNGSVGLADLRWLVESVRADIIAFQECSHGEDELRVVFPEFEVHSSFDACFLSRYLISKFDPRDREDIAALHGSGVINRYELSTATGIISVLNLHLETPRKGLEDIFKHPVGVPQALRNVIALRRVESGAARQWAARAHGPQIILGDFNMPQDSAIYRDFWSGYQNMFVMCGHGFGYSKYTNHWGIRIDQVLTNAQWECSSASVLGSLGGDHRPVFVTMRVK